MATVRKLIVELVDAQNLLPKDGHGASSPYAILDFHGQRRKTRTVVRDLNPTWNETVEFNVGKTSEVFGDMLELDVFHDRNIGPTTRNNFLGRVRLNSAQFVKKGEEALIYYPLEKKHLFSWISGEIGLKIYFTDVVVPPPPPPEPVNPPDDKKPAPEDKKPAPDEPPANQDAPEPEKAEALPTNPPPDENPVPPAEAASPPPGENSNSGTGGDSNQVDPLKRQRWINKHTTQRN